MTYLMAVLGFAFVIFIHELGHFLFAKWAGVRVDTFSIGMGPVIWSRTIGDTEYALSLLPVGGYVKMLGQEDVPGRAVDTSDARSFAAKHPAWRAAILFGGVLFNLVSSYLILIALAFYGVPVFPPTVGDIQEYFISTTGERIETPAWQLGLQRGDHIRAVNGQEVRSFNDVLMIGIAADGPLHMCIERDGTELSLPPAGSEPVHMTYNPVHGRPDLGISNPRSRRILAVTHFGAADPENLPQPGDYLVGIPASGDQFARHDGKAALESLTRHAGQEVTVSLERDGQTRTSTFRYAGDNDVTGPILGLPVVIGSVVPHMPAAEGGLQAGDVISSVDGESVCGSGEVVALVKRAIDAGRAITLRYQRPLSAGTYSEPRTVSLQPRRQERSGRILIGVHMRPLDAGVLPTLPTLPSGRGLAASTLTPGDALLRIGDLLTDGGALRERGAVLVLPAAEQRLISCSESEWFQLAHVERPGLLGRLAAKFFGWEPAPSLISQLAGARITRDLSDGSSVLQVERPAFAGEKARSRAIALHRIDPALRDKLAALRTGDWIAQRPGVGPDGTPALIALRSTQNARTVEVPLHNPGIALHLMVAEVPYQLRDWTDAFDYANDATSQMVGTTLKLIPKFFAAPEDGGIDASKSLQGPIGIFSELSARFEHLGFASFLKLIALIGLNLFLINLLPIPIVDGGQLLFLGIEVIIRRPVPAKVQEAFNWLGFALIVSLMLYVIGNDIVNRL